MYQMMLWLKSLFTFLLFLCPLIKSEIIKTDVEDVSMGKAHTCALFTNEKIKCWGTGQKQLGYGKSAKPVKHVHSLRSPHAEIIWNTKFTNICSGNDYTCAIKKVDNKIYCWGYSAKFNTLDTAEPINYYENFYEYDVTQMSCGPETVCIIVNGNVYCWGANTYGQLGIGQSHISGLRTPKKVNLGASAIKISVSTHVCAVLTTNQVKCWGDNRRGQLGVGRQKVKQAVEWTLEDEPYESCHVTFEKDENGTIVSHKADTYHNLTADECAQHVPTNKHFIMIYQRESAFSSTFLIKNPTKCVICQDDSSTDYYRNSPFYNYTLEALKTYYARYTSNRWKPTLVQGYTANSIEVGSNRTCATSLTNKVDCWGNSSMDIVSDTFAMGMSYGCVKNNKDTSMKIGSYCWSYLNYKEKGPYKDTNSHALRYGPQQYGYNALTCSAACRNWTGHSYKYFSLQHNGQCFCDDDWAHATKYGEGSCDKMGGSLCNYIYEYVDSQAINLLKLDVGHDRTVNKFVISWGIPFSACAILDDKTLKCWGQNNKFQLGLGHANMVSNPTQVDLAVCLADNYLSDGKCIQCPNGTKTRVLSYGTYSSVRNKPSDCIYPPKIISMSPNYGSMSGFTQIILNGENFGTVNSERKLCAKNTRCIDYVAEPYKLIVQNAWEITFVSSNKLIIISTFGDTVKNIEYIVDGSKSNFDINYTYLIPVITEVSPPPRLGGTMVVIGEKFSPDAEPRTQVFVKIFNKCDLECVGVRILSSTEMQCEYEIEKKNDDNAAVFIRTKYGTGHRDSNLKVIQYEGEKGQLQGIPPLDQYVIENNDYKYSIWLSVNSSKPVNITITSESHTRDDAGNYVVKELNLKCNVDRKFIVVPPYTTSQIVVVVSTDGNSIDEGGKDAIAYRCTLKHTINSISPRYNKHPDKYLRLLVRNDDTAGLLLRAPGVDQNNTFRYKLNFLGPMCVAEASTVTYGVTLNSQPRKDVTIAPLVTLDHYDSPIKFNFHPANHVIHPSNWQSTFAFTLKIHEDDIDNVHEMDAINIEHTASSMDPIYQNNVDSIFAIFRVTDNDNAGILVPASSRSMVVAAGQSGTVIINGFSSQPMYQVSLMLALGEYSDKFSITPSSIIIQPQDFKKTFSFKMNISKFTPPGFTYLITLKTSTLDGKYQAISIPINIFVPSSEITEPKGISILRVNDKGLKVEWNKVQDASGYEIRWSTEREMNNASIPTYSRKSIENSFIVESDTELHKSVIHFKIRTIFMQATSDWSTTTAGWTVSGGCEPEHEYLNTTCAYPLGVINGCSRWTCESCPDGGYCTGEKQWTDVKAKFGYWRHNGILTERSNFTKCLFPLACLGAPNYFFRGQFSNKSGYDPAIIDQNERCHFEVGYEKDCIGDGAPRCRLCSTCKNGYRRRLTDGMARCDTCPTKEFGVVILIAGFLVVIVLLYVLIRMHIESGGKRK